MLVNVWNNIISWFSDTLERSRLIRSFNASARDAYINNIAPTMLKASISKGERSYRHRFSKMFYTGFRIEAFTGSQLSKEELIQIGQVIISNEVLVRRLVVLGWDTLEVQGSTGQYGCCWQLKDYLQIEQ